MRVLVCGGWWEGDTILILSHALRMMGHEFAHVATTRFAHDYDMNRAENEIKAVHPETFDLVIFWNNKECVDPEFVKRVAAKTRVLYWTVDPFPVGDRLYTHWDAIVRACPLAFFPSVDECEYYEKLGIKCYLNHSPYDVWSTSPSGKDFHSDVQFMAGTCYRWSDFPDQQCTRAEMVREVIKATPSLKLYGEWDTDRGWHVRGEVQDKNLWGGFASPDDQIEAARQAKISLSSHCRPTQRQCTRDGDTVVTGAGGFLLTDNVKDFGEVFKIGAECEVFTCMQELKDKITYYLMHEDERKKIALAGKNRTMTQYTNIQMVKLLEDIVSGKR